jgi:hypothetical protein
VLAAVEKHYLAAATAMTGRRRLSSSSLRVRRLEPTFARTVAVDLRYEIA